ncbi:MAG: AAA family ATPase [Colwellia sp.]|nr:AAA family ATPase [Colwellia sp.]
MMNFINTPATAVARTAQYLEFIKNSRRVSIGLPGTEKIINPLLPGDVVAVLGRPSHGKSAFTAHIANTEAKRIMEDGEAATYNKPEGKAVLYATWEETVEKAEMRIYRSFSQIENEFRFFDPNFDIDSYIRFGQTVRPSIPIWVAGQSFENKVENKPTKESGKKLIRTPMYIDDLMYEINETKEKYNVQFSVIIFDYLQSIPVKGKSEDARHAAIENAILDAQSLGIACKCPIVINVQAKAEVDKRRVKIPTAGDTFYSSALDHHVDLGIGVCKPERYYSIGSIIEFEAANGEQDLTVTRDTWIVNMWKQRDGIGLGKFVFNFDMSRLQISPITFNATPPF